MIGRRPHRAAPVAPEPSAGLPGPGLNTLITLSVGDDPERHSRVEDHDGSALGVAAPLGPTGEAETLEAGTAVLVHWHAPNGQFELDTELAESRHGTVEQWWLHPTAPVRKVQRRQYVRARASGWPVLVELTWMLPTEQRCSGDLVDLSEGGMRVRMPEWSAPDGTAVAVRMTLAEANGGADAAVTVQEFELMGTVLRALPVTAVAGSRATDLGFYVMVQFHEDTHDADALRSLIFSWQRRARHDGRE